MTSDLHTAMDTLRGSVIECRAENVRYRQNELYALHSALREKAEAICKAIAEDYAQSAQKVEQEFYLGMDAVRKSYESLNFDKSLIEEYSVKFGKDNLDRRAAVGLVAVSPARHSRFYSVLTPVVAAIEAGNSVLVELDGSSPAVDRILSEILPKALDQDTFRISTSSIDQKYLDQIDVWVDQFSSLRRLDAKPAPQRRALCILDRTGDIEIAAKAIVESRTSPDCASPYSPDLILVNEFIKEAFVESCLRHARNIETISTARNETVEERELQKELKQAEAKGEIRIYRSKGLDLSVVELKERSSKLATTKVVGPYVLLLSTSGVVDMVTSQRELPKFLASYIFASPSVCKFIAEQLPSDATYMNHLPLQLLIGPASPANHPHALHPRFTSDMFSSPCPQFIKPPLPLPNSSKLKELTTKELKPTGQKVGNATGFFQQGLLLGLGSAAAVVLPIAGWGMFTLGKYGWKVVRYGLK